MSNNKQSSVEMMWNEIDNLFPFKDSVEAQNFCAILDKYKAMHKTEHFNTWWHGISENEPITFEQYYNETFGGNNELQ